MKFKLIINGPTYQNEYFDLFTKHDFYHLRISSTTVKGTITVNTKPKNALLIFKELDNAARSSGELITYPVDNYKVTITKPYFSSIDTVLSIKAEGSTETFELNPQFPSIRINIHPADRKEFLKPFLLWIDSTPVDLRALTNHEVKPASFDNAFEPLKLYEGNIVPLEQTGRHKYKIEAEGYLTEEAPFFTPNYETIEIPLVMKPLVGSLSILDDGKAESAQVFVNKQYFDVVPFINKPLNSGEYSITIKKEGYISLKDEYIVKISANEDTTVRVSMELFKEFYFKTDPPKAEIWVDGKMKGFSNDTISIPALHHNITIVKSGYATEKFNIFVDEKTLNREEIYRKLKVKYPITIRNEGKRNFQLDVQGVDSLANIFLDNENNISGKENLLPYGKYRLTLTEGKAVVYQGRHIHSPKYRPIITLPVYSRTSFRALALDYVDPNNFEVSLGQNQLFGGSGLSTAILNLQYLYTEVKRSTTDIPEYKDTIAILIPNIFLLNWDFRVGGSIFRYLDICALGRFKYTPGLKFTGISILGLNDATMLTYFYGLEISSRLPYFNLNCKIGNQVLNGKSYIYDQNIKSYSSEGVTVRNNRPVITFGLVINGPIERANNMVRLWKRPLLDEYFRAIFRKVQ